MTLAFLPFVEESTEVPARRGEPVRRLPRLPRPLLVSLLVLAIAQAVVALDLDLPVVRPAIALVTFLGLPTLLLHRRASLTADTPYARLSYAFGLSLLGLLVGGLVLDTVLPWVGIDRPLAPAPLAVAWLLIDAALLLWRQDVPLVEADVVRTTYRRVVDARLELAPALGSLALVLSVLGAVRLNNGAGGGVALVAELLAAAALLALLQGRAPRRVRDVLTLGLVAAGLLLATSVRGWSITGHDIQAEFLAFRLTNEAQAWDMSALPSAYNACLSVNILPTVLVQTTGLPGELVFKVLLQLVFATVPVLTYLFSRRFVSRRLALVAAILTMAFPTFFTDMPYLVRQEVAFFFLALMLLAATEPGRTRLRSRLLVLTFGIGVVLSHYSTTYVLLMAMVAALLGLGLLSVRKAGRVRREPLMLLHPLVVVGLVAATLAWAGPITGTGGHAREVLSETVDALTGHGAEGPSSSDASYWIFSGDQTTPRERMDLFVRDSIAYRDARIPEDQRVVSDPGPAELQPALHDQETAPPTALGSALDAVGLDPVHVNNAVKLGCALLMQGFALLGMIWMIRRRGGRLSLEVGLLSVGAMAALGLIVLVPNLSVDYGVLRAFQQTMLVIAPLMAMGMWVALRPLALKSPRAAIALSAVVPLGLFLVLTGLLPAALGGQQQRIAFANAGTYYDRLYSSDIEVDGMHWLASIDHADRSNERTIANRNVNVRMLALSGNRAPVSDRLYPTLLSKDAYVFVDSQILDEGVSTIFYTGDLLTYDYPIRDLDEHLDLVYSSPDARVYR
ncbi:MULTISPECIES: DUF2206 domain-containing protein [unclassified Nocardioides]|uniref:DUF2206 domain-containing protein n=1 Tax=unclassified Nocardioides TaxID=2615069 RepID=UPI000B27BBA2|nr:MULTISPECIES: DUF2206 domain-containing protein [unclassified Nocardioides]